MSKKFDLNKDMEFLGEIISMSHQDHLKIRTVHRVHKCGFSRTLLDISKTPYETLSHANWLTRRYRTDPHSAIAADILEIPEKDVTIPQRVLGKRINYLQIHNGSPREIRRLKMELLRTL